MTTQDGAGGHDKDFDLVLFGATGFTGRLVAEVLVKKRPALRWALAGRSRDKLEQIRGELAVLDPAARDLPLVIGDSLDPASVAAMVRRTRVVCTTVGPYARYGTALVAACAAEGVHYCDLTGEALYSRANIEQHHERAVATGARIVHCCGFDAIPSDLGVLTLHEHFKARGKRLAEAHLRVMKLKGGASGGTIASAVDMAEQMRDPAIRKIALDPYALYPAGAARGEDRRDQTGWKRETPWKHDEDGDRWTAPFVMAAINTRIVRRSNALLDFAYGKDFRYDEATDTGRGLKGFASAVAMSTALGAGLGLMALPATRGLLTRLLPKPGEGPSKEARDNGSFRILIHGTSPDGERADALVAGNHDPGYGETAIMLAESALCLAEDALSTPGRDGAPPQTPGGVLTPASSMGMTLVERLRKAGMTFEVKPAVH